MAKIILTHEVDGLGNSGDVLEVKNGYARNFLIPKGFALGWTKGAEKHVDQIRQGREAKVLATREDAVKLKSVLESQKVKLVVKAGKEGRLFGSVKAKDIALAIQDAGIASLDKHTIRIPSPVKIVGEHTAIAKIHEGIEAKISLQIVAAK